MMGDANDPWAAFNPQPAPQTGPVIYGAPKSSEPPQGYAPIGKPVTPLTYVPGGPHDPTRITPDPGYHLLPDNSEVPNKGGPHDPNNPENALTPDALDDTTSKLILTGQMDPMGMGGGPVRLQILNNRPVMLNKYGITAQQLPSIQAQFKADSQAYAQRVQQLSFIQQATGAANQHIHQIMDYLQQLPAQTNARGLNAISNYAQRQMSGETITNLDTTIPLLESEMAKIMTANPSGAATLTDDARHEFDTLRSNVAPERKIEALQALQQMGQGKINGLKTEIDGLHSRLTGGLQTYAQLAHSGILGAPPQPPGGGTPPQNGTAPPGSPAAQGTPTPPSPPGMGGTPGGGNTPPPVPNDQVTPSTGQTKDVIDASMTPVRREYTARLQAGQSAQQLVSFLKQAGATMSPDFVKSVADQATFRRQHPDVPISQYNTAAIDHHTEQMGVANRAVNAVGQTDVGAGAIAAGNAVLANQGPRIIGALGGNEEQARLAGQYSAQDHPGAALTGALVGGTAAALAGEAGIAKLGMEAGFGRTLLADTGYGAAAGNGTSPDHPVEGTVIGGIAGAAGSVGGQALARGFGRAVQGISNADVGKLVNSGVPLTIGQAVGGIGKSIEDKLASFVPAIANRRAEGVRVFNQKAFDKALEPIGQTVGSVTGEDGIAAAREKVSQAFSTALQGKQAVPDNQFIGDARAALQRLGNIKRDNLGPEIVGQIEVATKDLFDPNTGAISGENMQTFLESLRQIKQAYRNDPLSQTVIAPAIKQIQSATEGMFQRQAPEVMPAYNAAKAAYRRVAVLSDAVNKANNTGGVFTPAQLGQADLANAKKLVGAINAASGNRSFSDLQRPAQNVLPSKIPDSGTAGRVALLAVPAAIAGTGAAGYEVGGEGGARTGIGLATLLSLLYSRRGQSALVSAAVKRGAAAKATGAAIRNYLAPVAGAAGASLPATTASR